MYTNVHIQMYTYIHIHIYTYTHIYIYTYLKYDIYDIYDIYLYIYIDMNDIYYIYLYIYKFNGICINFMYSRCGVVGVYRLYMEIKYVAYICLGVCVLRGSMCTI